MSEGLKAFLKRCKPVHVDEELVEDFRREMRAAVPRRVALYKAAQRRAAEYRRGIIPGQSQRPKPQGD